MSANSDQQVIPPSLILDDDSKTNKPRNKRASSKTKPQSATKRTKCYPSKESTITTATGTPNTGELHAADDSPLSETTLPNDVTAHVECANNSDKGPTHTNISADHLRQRTPPPALANTHPDFTDVNYIPYSVLQRATAFALKVDDQNNRFAISKVPAGTDWGSTSTTDCIYCFNNQPITYWLVGVVGSKWFTNFKGEPQLHVNVGLCLPFQTDDNDAKKIYNLTRPPKKDDEIPDLVYASKYMARHVRGSADAIAVPFKDVYDAQRRFRSKREMCVIPPAYISKNNLVLVEAFLTRWNTAKDKKNKSDWKSWDVSFELQAISLLFEAPPSTEDDEYSLADNIRDDM